MIILFLLLWKVNNMLIQDEIKQRIINAAEELYIANPEKLPTVSEVRAIAKTDMNSTSSVMKAWRTKKLMPVQRIEENAPPALQELALQLASQIWTTAKEQAEDKLRQAESKFMEERQEAEELRLELSQAYDENFALLNQVETELVRIQQDKQQLEHVNLELKQQLDEVSQARIELSGECKSYKSEKEQLQKQVQMLEALLTESKQEKLTIERKHRDENQHLMQKINLLEQQANERNSEIAVLNNKLENNIQQHNADLTQFTKQLNVAQEQLKDKESLFYELEKELLTAQAQIKIEQAKMNELNKHNEKLVSLLERRPE